MNQMMQRYYAPTAGADLIPYASEAESAPGLASQGLYAGPMYPVKYYVPGEQEERHQARSAIRRAAGTEGLLPNVMRYDQITEGEVDMLLDRQKRAELVDFDAYVQSLVDPRKPGSLKWLMEIYPDFVKRRLQQVHTDYEFALRNQMIDMWGMNSFDDLHFKYLVDQKKVTGPYLMDNAYMRKDDFAWAAFSPFNHLFSKDTKGQAKGGLYAPFSSARYGIRPKEGHDWLLQGGKMQQGRSQDEMALGLYDGQTQHHKAPEAAKGTGMGALGDNARRAYAYQSGPGNHQWTPGSGGDTLKQQLTVGKAQTARGIRDGSARSTGTDGGYHDP